MTTTTETNWVIEFHSDKPNRRVLRYQTAQSEESAMNMLPQWQQYAENQRWHGRFEVTKVTTVTTVTRERVYPKEEA